MTAIDLPIDQDEWVRVEKAVSATDLDDLVNPPVLVHPHPGAADRPHWRIRGRDGTLVEIRHDLPPTRRRSPGPVGPDTAAKGHFLGSDRVPGLARYGADEPPFLIQVVRAQVGAVQFPTFGKGRHGQFGLEG